MDQPECDDMGGRTKRRRLKTARFDADFMDNEESLMLQQVFFHVFSTPIKTYNLTRRILRIFVICMSISGIKNIKEGYKAGSSGYSRCSYILPYLRGVSRSNAVHH